MSSYELNTVLIASWMGMGNETEKTKISSYKNSHPVLVKKNLSEMKNLKKMSWEHDMYDELDKLVKK